MAMENFVALALLVSLLLVAALTQGGFEYIRQTVRARQERRAMRRAIRAMATVGVAFSRFGRGAVLAMQEFEASTRQMATALQQHPEGLLPE